MDENLKFALTLAAGALGGAVVAGLFALIGAWIANKREHRQWLRNERLKAYETYFAETRPWAAKRWISTDIDASKDAQSATMQLQLVAPKKVLDTSYALVQQISDYRSMHVLGRKRAEATGTKFEFDEPMFEHHVRVVEQRSAELGRAMRRSLKLSRRESKHWISLIQEDAPSEEEYRSRMSRSLRKFRQAQG